MNPHIHGRHSTLCCLIFATSFLLHAAACSDSEGDDGDGQGSPDSGMMQGNQDAGVSGPTFPTIQVSPSNGALGVKVDDPIVLTFSEPMDTVSVEAAWMSDALQKDDLEFNWNAEGTILTIDASAALAYPFGGVDVDRFDYEFTIQKSASDAEGDELENDFSSSFATARDITLVLSTVSGGTGAFDTGSQTTLAPVRVGDTVDNSTHVGFVTFDLAEIPSAVVEFTEVTLYSNQNSTGGTPYQDLGTVELHHIEPTTMLVYNSVTSVPRTNLGDYSVDASTGVPDGDRTADITSELAADVDDGAAVSSYRLMFTTAQDLGNDEDYAFFQDFRADVRLLAE